MELIGFLLIGLAAGWLAFSLLVLPPLLVVSPPQATRIAAATNKIHRRYRVGFISLLLVMERRRE